MSARSYRDGGEWILLAGYVAGMLGSLEIKLLLAGLIAFAFAGVSELTVESIID